MSIRNPLSKHIGYVLPLLVIGITFTLAGCTLFGKPPIAIADATPLAGEAPLTVVFDGSQSFDPDGTIISFSWNFNDGSPTASGQTVSHKFQSEGVFKVVLTVTDNSSLQDSDKLFITVGRSSLYFSSNRRTGSNFEILRMDTDGNHQAQVTVASPPLDDVLPSLLPNTRSKLAFSSDRNTSGTLDIFTADPDGTLLSNLTVAQTGSHEIQPAWFADGSHIAFASNQTGIWEIFVMNSDGTGVKNLTTTSGGTTVAPAVSPDGSRIAFASNCDAIALSSAKASLSSCGNDFELFVMVLNASHDVIAVSKLTSNTTNDGALGPDLGPSGLGVTALNLGFGLATPSWSPDGTRLAFTAQPGVTTDIHICNFDATTNSCATISPLPNASDSGFDEFDPHWFVDSDGAERVAFTTNRPTGGTVYQIWKVKLDGSGLTQLTSVGTNVQPAEVEGPAQ